MLKRSEQNSSPGKWNFPGGEVEDGETEQEAALRELEEETGMEGEILQSGETFISEGELGLWKIYPFLVETGNAEVEINHEHSEYRWIGPDEIEEVDALGSMRALNRLDVKIRSER